MSIDLIRAFTGKTTCSQEESTSGVSEAVMTSKMIDMSKEITKAQERINPVFRTDKTAICLMAKAELPLLDYCFGQCKAIA